MLLIVPINTAPKSEVENELEDLIPGYENKVNWTRKDMAIHPEAVTGCFPDGDGSCIIGVIGFEGERQVLLSFDEFIKRWKKSLVELHELGLTSTGEFYIGSQE